MKNELSTASAVEDSFNPMALLQRKNMTIAIDESLSQLTEREAEVNRMRFGLDSDAHTLRSLFPSLLFSLVFGIFVLGE